jgi:lysozyme
LEITVPVTIQLTGKTLGTANFRGVLALCSMLGLAACSSLTGDTYADLDKPVPGIFLDEARAAFPEGFQLRQVSDKGLTLTKVSEGFVARLYNDPAGFCTIAYGHLIKKRRCDGTEAAEFRPHVSEVRGAELLVDDMAMAQYAVMTLVRASANLSDGQYAALVDFTFNVGATNFKKSTLLKLVNARKLDLVPHEWGKWVLADGKPYPGLVTRREGEIQLFFDGMPRPRAAVPEGEEGKPIDIRVGG